jgi:hypothetical protein
MKVICHFFNVSIYRCAVQICRKGIGMSTHYFIGIVFLLLGSLPAVAQILQPMPIVEEKVEYDALTNRYLIRTIIGGQEMEVPIIMTPAEYLDWSMKRSMQNYYRQRNDSVFTKEKEDFDFTNMKFNLGPAEKIFGPGGVQIRTQGSAELSMGMKYNNVQNPTLPENMRKTWGFDFDEKININVNGKVGDKVNLDMNSNPMFIFDGAVASTKGNLSTILVSHWLSRFHDAFSPHRVFEIGSSPIATLVVIGFSPRCIMVPPNWKSGEKSYVKFNPNIVFRCML